MTDLPEVTQRSRPEGAWNALAGVPQFTLEDILLGEPAVFMADSALPVVLPSDYAAVSYGGLQPDMPSEFHLNASAIGTAGTQPEVVAFPQSQRQDIDSAEIEAAVRRALAAW